APSEDPSQALPRQRAPQVAAREPLHRGHRPRAHQDDRGEGQGRQAGDREADHAGAQGRPALAPPGDVHAAAPGQGHHLQAVRRDRPALHGASRRLHPHSQARPAPLGLHRDGVSRAGL
ncbi:MAG: LSU ribosomal protein L17p, partial [uncultured Solirubrobacteraceae bacterium]